MNDEKVDIVIVEDDPSDAELITRVFRKHNMANKIVLLKDGAEALDFFFGGKANDHPKVVLLDLKLPKVNGIEVLQRLKSDERTKNIPVVVLTSSAESQDIKDAYKYGVNSYVTKPIRFEDFANAVTELRMYWLLLNKPSEGQTSVRDAEEDLTMADRHTLNEEMMGGKVEIVIVEDNPNDAELILRAFRKHNMANQVVHLKDGAEALDFFFPPNGPAPGGANAALKVVLLDLKLPKVDGIEVLRRLKANERTRSIPVVVLTSSTEQRDLQGRVRVGRQQLCGQAHQVR